MRDCGMSKFKITVARIEVDARCKRSEQVRITFQVDRAAISFQVPLLLNIRDFTTPKWSKLHEVPYIGHSWNSRAKAKTQVNGARPATAFEHELASKDIILAHTRSSLILFTP
jgi:hypothetical protein